jgi:hypothetical protein
MPFRSTPAAIWVAQQCRDQKRTSCRKRPAEATIAGVEQQARHPRRTEQRAAGRRGRAQSGPGRAVIIPGGGLWQQPLAGITQQHAAAVVHRCIYANQAGDARDAQGFFDATR